jgi:hypothetical protein
LPTTRFVIASEAWQSSGGGQSGVCACSKLSNWIAASQAPRNDGERAQAHRNDGKGRKLLAMTGKGHALHAMTAKGSGTSMDLYRLDITPFASLVITNSPVRHCERSVAIQWRWSIWRLCMQQALQLDCRVAGSSQ